jgi:hypothetical protein
MAPYLRSLALSLRGRGDGSSSDGSGSGSTQQSRGAEAGGGGGGGGNGASGVVTGAATPRSRWLSTVAASLSLCAAHCVSHRRPSLRHSLPLLTVCRAHQVSPGAPPRGCCGRCCSPRCAQPIPIITIPGGGCRGPLVGAGHARPVGDGEGVEPRVRRAQVSFRRCRFSPSGDLGHRGIKGRGRGRTQAHCVSGPCHPPQVGVVSVLLLIINWLSSKQSR